MPRQADSWYSSSSHVRFIRSVWSLVCVLTLSVAFIRSILMIIVLVFNITLFYTMLNCNLLYHLQFSTDYSRSENVNVIFVKILISLKMISPTIISTETSVIYVLPLQYSKPFWLMKNSVHLDCCVRVHLVILILLYIRVSQTFFS